MTIEPLTRENCIEFNRPYAAEKSFEYMRDAIVNAHTCGDGVFSKKCQNFLEDHLGVPRALLTTSCTDALEMVAVLLDVKPGDEVILPSYTFVSTANAFALRGAIPVFCDIRSDSLNIDECKIEERITENTKAIVPVHYAGVACEMDMIMKIAGKHNVPVIEDNAHGLFGKYKGQSLGTFGAMATQSFHETKNFNCGEGGAILINDIRYTNRAEIIREKGTNRSRYFRGQVDKYTWVDIGSSHLPSDLLAAFLWAQFEMHDQIQQKRADVWNLYDCLLDSWAGDNHVRRPFVPHTCEQAYHMYYLIMPSLKDRQKLISHLKSANIVSPFHYLPLHISAMGYRFGGLKGDCPVTEEISDCLIRLPFHNSITQDEIIRVVEEISKYRVG